MYVAIIRLVIIHLTSLALVSRANIEGGTRLKAAAAMVASGDLSVTCKTIWEGEISDRERLMQKVGSLMECVMFLTFGRKRKCSLLRRTRCRWSHSISFRIPAP